MDYELKHFKAVVNRLDPKRYAKGRRPLAELAYVNTASRGRKRKRTHQTSSTEEQVQNLGEGLENQDLESAFEPDSSPLPDGFDSDDSAGEKLSIELGRNQERIQSDHSLARSSPSPESPAHDLAKLSPRTSIARSKLQAQNIRPSELPLRSGGGWPEPAMPNCNDGVVTSPRHDSTLFQLRLSPSSPHILSPPSKHSPPKTQIRIVHGHSPSKISELAKHAEAATNQETPFEDHDAKWPPSKKRKHMERLTPPSNLSGALESLSKDECLNGTAIELSLRPGMPDGFKCLDPAFFDANEETILKRPFQNSQP